jgi:DNA-binding transcriptional ArsR family regulator
LSHTATEEQTLFPACRAAEAAGTAAGDEVLAAHERDHDQTGGCTCGAGRAQPTSTRRTTSFSRARAPHLMRSVPRGAITRRSGRSRADHAVPANAQLFLAWLCKTVGMIDLPVIADPDDALSQLTRARLFALLSELMRPAQTAELATRLGLHPNGVRVHLERLQRQGLVERGRVRPRRGRPPDAWTISPNAQPGGRAPRAYRRGWRGRAHRPADRTRACAQRSAARSPRVADGADRAGLCADDRRSRGRPHNGLPGQLPLP